MNLKNVNGIISTSVYVTIKLRTCLLNLWNFIIIGSMILITTFFPSYIHCLYFFKSISLSVSIFNTENRSKDDERISIEEGWMNCMMGNGQKSSQRVYACWCMFNLLHADPGHSHRSNFCSTIEAHHFGCCDSYLS